MTHTVGEGQHHLLVSWLEVRGVLAVKPVKNILNEMTFSIDFMVSLFVPMVNCDGEIPFVMGAHLSWQRVCSHRRSMKW